MSKISTYAAEDMIDYLKAPIKRVNSLATPAQFVGKLEQQYVVSELKIVEVVSKTMKE